MPAIPKKEKSGRVTSRGGRPKTSEAKGRTDRLLDFALDAFLQDGLSATIDAIAAEARVSKKTVYARYKDKKELFVAATERFINQRNKDVAPLDTHLPLDKLLARFASQLLELGCSPEMRRLQILTLRTFDLGFPEILESLSHENETYLIRPLADHFEKLAERGEIRQVDTFFAAELFLDCIYHRLNRILIEAHLTLPAAEIEQWARSLGDYHAHALDWRLIEAKL